MYKLAPYYEIWDILNREKMTEKHIKKSMHFASSEMAAKVADCSQ